MGSKGKTQDSNEFLGNNWINKYTIAGLAFVIWVGFLDGYNWVSQLKLNAVLSELNDDKREMQDKLEHSEAELKKFKENKEEYFRKERLYKKDNETIVLIETEQ